MPLLAKAFGWPEFSRHAGREHSRRHAQEQPARPSTATWNRRCSADASSAATSACRIRSATSRNSSPTCARAISISDWSRRPSRSAASPASSRSTCSVCELFGWSPQAFDARLATPKGDKSRHRISAKAVSSLSNVGGGGGGVVQALQSGVLQVLRRIQLRQARHHLPAARRRLRDVGHRARAERLLHRQGRRACRASTSSATRGASTGIS